MQEATTLDHTRVHLSTDHELTHDIRLELNKIVTGVAHLLLLNQNIGVNSQQEVHPARSPLPTGGSSQQEVHRPFETVIQDRTFGDQVHATSKPRHDGNEAHEEGLEYGNNMAEIAADNMAATFAAVGDPEA